MCITKINFAALGSEISPVNIIMLRSSVMFPAGRGSYLIQSGGGVESENTPVMTPPPSDCFSRCMMSLQLPQTV